jgi:hypothetical protein
MWSEDNICRVCKVEVSTADVVGAIDCSYRRISEKEYIHVETISVALELAYKFLLCLIQVQQRIEGCGSS